MHTEKAVEKASYNFRLFGCIYVKVHGSIAVFFPLTHQVVVSETNSQHDLKAQTRETKHPLISQHARDLKLIWMLGAKKLKPQDPSPAITHLTLLVVALTPFNSWVAASNKDPVQTVKTTVAASANWVNRVRKVASEIDKFRTCRFLLVNSTWLRVGEVLGKSPKIILKFKDSTCFSNSGGVFNWSCWWFCWKLVEVMGRISLFSFGHSIPHDHMRQIFDDHHPCFMNQEEFRPPCI